ncbi:hypothetical protein BDV95DRAFT_42749 [Massariosphaeria phaeospora]|uniref:Uncharacterized protein n=1 Tax=Massariosphaeria phaeospora TaxID=100035 RepID=A0A7C8IDN6_9PLEO|nr:hypothetical protein BDV95DRAFT_42749 [Massariosphaeria phaeospora]
MHNLGFVPGDLWTVSFDRGVSIPHSGSSVVCTGLATGGDGRETHKDYIASSFDVPGTHVSGLSMVIGSRGAEAQSAFRRGRTCWGVIHSLRQLKELKLRAPSFDMEEPRTVGRRPAGLGLDLQDEAEKIRASSLAESRLVLHGGLTQPVEARTEQMPDQRYTGGRVELIRHTYKSLQILEFDDDLRRWTRTERHSGDLRDPYRIRQPPKS